jgi:hypothetical protein
MNDEQREWRAGQCVARLCEDASRSTRNTFQDSDPWRPNNS